MKKVHYHHALTAIVLSTVFSYGLYSWVHPHDLPAVSPTLPGDAQTAYFAGGRFWYIEADLEKIPGVTGVVVGYSGGRLLYPTYNEVLRGTTGHREAIEVRYDPTRLTHHELTRYFLSRIDPVDKGGQFADKGEMYASAVFYRTEKEKKTSEELLGELANTGIFKSPIRTEVIPFRSFWPAEEYHQDFYKKNPIRYSFFRSVNGRDKYIEYNCSARAKAGLFCPPL